MTGPDDRSVPGQRRGPDGAWSGDRRDLQRDTTVLDHDDRTNTIPVARPDRDGDGVDDRRQGRFGGAFGLRRGDRDRDGDGVPDRVDHHDDRRDGDGSAPTVPVATATDHDAYDHDRDVATAADVRDRERLGWNAGADVGLLLMRLVLGGVFLAHGAQKVFGWWGGPGLDGFAQQLSGMGFRQADALAAVTGFTELVGGALVILGIFTPLAAAGLLGVAINAVWLKWNGGLFAQDNGFEFELTLAALAAGITLTGAGRAALDNGRVWFRHPVVTGLLCLAIGVGSAILVRVLFLET